MSSRPLVIIRANEEQTAVLKAAYTASQNLSSREYQELSQQTGLPAKWIGRWFGRQRTKSRKAGVSEVIDLTAAPRETTAPVQNPASETVKIKTECQETDNLPSSTVSSTSAQGSTGTKPRKKVRRKRPPPKKPHGKVTAPQAVPQEAQVSKTAADSRITRAATPAHSITTTKSQKKSIHSQNTSEGSADASLPKVYTPTGYSPAVDSTETQSAVSNGDCSDPFPAEDASIYDKGLGFEFRRSSSPTSSDVRGNASTQVQSLASSDPLCGLSLLTAEPFSGQPASWNSSSQALVSLFSQNPAAYHAMLARYAALLPIFLPALASIAASANQSLTPEVPAPVPVLSSPSLSADVVTPGWGTQNYGSPRLPPQAANDDCDGLLGVHDSFSTQKQTQDVPLVSSSDTFDFSCLHYDYGTFDHPQERRESFHLPESVYLFGQEGGGNHLLGDRPVVGEPFGAAMGISLLSKLGLQW